MKVQHVHQDINDALTQFIANVRQELNGYWDQQVVQKALELQQKKKTQVV